MLLDGPLLLLDGLLFEWKGLLLSLLGGPKSLVPSPGSESTGCSSSAGLHTEGSPPSPGCADPHGLTLLGLALHCLGFASSHVIALHFGFPSDPQVSTHWDKPGNTGCITLTGIAAI